MKKVHISQDVQDIIKGFGVISKEMIINKEKIFVRSQDERSITGEYSVNEGDIQYEKEFGLSDVENFFKIVESFGKDSEIQQSGNMIVIKSGQKRLKFNTNPIELLEESCRPNIQKDENGEDYNVVEKLLKNGNTTISFVLNEEFLINLKKDIKLISTDKLEIISKDGNIFIKGTNQNTENQIYTQIEPNLISKADGSFIFNSVDCINAIIQGNYKVIIKDCKLDEDTDIQIMRLESVDINGLNYTIAGA